MPEATLSETALISIVDDDEFVREALRGLLRSLGFTIEAFPSAQDFLESVRLRETSCLIADVHMPAMTGLELYGRLVESGHAIPTILITAYPDDSMRARALNNGVTCYLSKPFEEDDLLRCVRSALQRRNPTEGSHEPRPSAGNVN
jgi:FixJ family two-component response regulator